MSGETERAAGASRTGERAIEAIAVYRRLLDRYRHTLDLMSPRGFERLDAMLSESERYAVAIEDLADRSGPVLDLGSGAGLPGVVVAVRLAPRIVWWVERRRRRAAFLSQVAAQTGLTAVRVVGDDVRRLATSATGPVVAVTAQAVAPLPVVAALSRHLWADDVLLVCRKGPDWAVEVGDLRRAARTWVSADGGTPGGAEVDVVRAESLGTRGTLIAVRVQGGSACPSSV